MHHDGTSQWVPFVSQVQPQSAVAALQTPHHPSHTISRTVASASTHSVGLLPMIQVLGVLSSDGLLLELTSSWTRGPSPPPSPSSTFLASGASAGLHENDTQGPPFSSWATMGSISFHPSSSGGSDPYHARTVGIVATASAQNASPSLVGKGQSGILHLHQPETIHPSAGELGSHPNA